MTATPDPLPIWPGWHRMPPPIAVRWSRDAWEALYGEPWQPHWKPWPWEPEPPAPKQMTGEEIWEAILELHSRPMYRPQPQPTEFLGRVFADYMRQVKPAEDDAPAPGL